MRIEEDVSLPYLAVPPRILTGPEARDEIQNLIAEAEVIRLAVAYWGSGSVDELGIRAALARGADVEIVCDLRSGACNPAEIRSLLSILSPGRLLTQDRLHAKVWMSDKGLVLGSSNASANGLGHEGPETLSLIEANVALPIFKMAGQSQWVDWYQRYVRPDAVPVTLAMIAECESSWKLRRSNRDVLVGENTPRKLIDRLIADPGFFNDKPLRVAIYEQGRRSNGQHRLLEKSREQLQLGEDTLDAFDWPLDPGTYVIEFNWDSKKRKASKSGFWRVLSDDPRRKHRDGDLYLALKVKDFAGLSFPISDQLRLARLVTSLMRARLDADENSGQDLDLSASEFCQELRLFGISEAGVK